MNIEQLAASWIEAKAAEKLATEKRRELEDELTKAFEVSSTLDSTYNVDHELFTIKIVGRLDRKVDSDRLQDIAAEHGLTGHLSQLFRWKAEVNMTAWKATDESITKVLSEAITVKPGRPSFTISRKDV